MLDDIREWISDNLRYILLGAAGLLLILIIVFAVRLIGGRGKSEKDTPKKKVEETEEMTSAPDSGESAGTQGTASGDPLERNQKDVLDLVTRYYTARLNKDYDTLGEICEVLDDESKTGYEAMEDAIEAYNNLMTYSKPGLTAGSYVVFAYFDAKLTGIDTAMPTLRGLYLVTNDDGDLIVSDIDSHKDQKDYLNQVLTDDDVQVLNKDVADRCNDSIAQDSDLAAFVESISSESGNTDGNVDTQGDGSEDGSDTGDGEGDSPDGNASGGKTGTMYASTGVNVRAEPSAESTLYATLSTGMQVEVLENLDNGWSHISFYTSDGTTMEGYLMTQYLTDAQ